MSKKTTASNDSEDLEALFDSIVMANKEGAAASAPAAPAASAAKSEEEDVIHEIGKMTRTLHDSLRELGYDKKLEKAASKIPDSRDRLNYIATMTQQAAERVLNATDAAQPLMAKVESDARTLAADWQKLFDNKMDVEQFKQLATRTHAYLVEVPKQTRQTSAHLTEIMMAQDFQDLTGQVIKKIMEVTQDLEQQLLVLLVQHAPPEAKIDPSLLNGPVVNASGRADVVTSQAQVDELLESLGF
ncbi:MAG TPA: protein phosphatase CheZ [Gallionellaceae bacterium]|nr:protein phosphatase CheZ [Gallionellaceae bacterium]